MIQVILSLDYEIHGNGEGSPLTLMVQPTDRLLRLCDVTGAKLTILADIAEILKFKEHLDRSGVDAFHYREVVDQLRRAVRGGHDVQLHIHASYFNACHDGRRWIQEWSDYDFAGLDLERMSRFVRLGKEFLESLLQPVRPDYRCTVFRAANWSVSPSENVVRALLDNQIAIDTSVFKYGVRRGLVSFDYHSAASEMCAWRADANALWREDPHGPVWEVPIYSEHRRLGAFFSLNRIYRAVLSRLHSVAVEPPNRATPSARPAAPTSFLSRRLEGLVARHAWKADFNQCTGTQLIRALQRGTARHGGGVRPVPFVLIGHSKLFTAWNVHTLRPFLQYVAAHPSQFAFGTYHSLELPALNGKGAASVMGAGDQPGAALGR